MAKKASSDGGSIKATVTEKLKQAKKGFDLEAFKKSKNISEVKFKSQEWLPLSDAFQDAISLPGVPLGHVVMLRGHSDTGKTTAMIEAAISAQKLGKLPVFIVTEMKWSWEHAKIMGFDVNEDIDPATGKVSYTGDFIYVDRDNLSTIEDVAGFIADLLDEQAKGKLPLDLVFLWDSVGSIPCKLSVESKKNNNEWNAGALSTQFGNFINQMIIRSRKESSPYTNTLIVVNKVWVEKPSMPMEMPKLKNKGGNTMFFDASLVVTFGNVTNAGTSKIKATKDGRQVEFAKRTKVSVDKNHITGVTTVARIVATPHGFIKDTPTELNNYKKAHSKEWLQILGSTDFDIEQEDEMQESINDILEDTGDE
jgi:RecA/RadA recombinase